MMTVTDEQLDLAKAEALISSVPLIPEVAFVSVELYTDHTGDPALQLIICLKRDVLLDDAVMNRFRSFKVELQTAILHSDLERFPYTRLEQAA